MFGVVLWSDEQEQKAVFWCEDHGDLAFYANTGHSLHLGLDPGDWVQFDMTMKQDQRFAHNPRLVCEGVYSGLADALCATNPTEPAPTLQSEAMRYSAQVIPFAPPSTNRTEAAEMARVNLG
jgi:hypothetical protein